MTLIVLGQTGLIGNSLKKYYPNDSLDFSISNWDIENFNAEVSFRINELSKLPDSLDIVWAAGISNNSSNSSIIHNEICIIKVFLKFLLTKNLSIRSINFISSAGSIFNPEKTEKIDEKTAISPISEYGKSRLLIEKLFCEAASGLNVKFNTFRLTNVFGNNVKYRKNSGLISHLINANLNRKEMNIFVPLYVEQDYIDDEFVAKNILYSINKQFRSSFRQDIFYLSRNQSNSIVEIINLIDRFLGRKTPYVMVDIDTSKVRQNNLNFNFDNKKYLPFEIEPINLKIKKLINEMIYEKIS
jgi:nucleoside-diphosphate-sugar epimerase